MNRQDEKFIAQKIRTQYTEKTTTKLDKLKKLDARAKLPALIFAYVWGIISAIIMGCGMSLVMTDIGNMIGLRGNIMAIGIVIGCTGLVMALVTYPIFNAVLKSGRKKFAPEIIRISREIENS